MAHEKRKSPRRNVNLTASIINKEGLTVGRCMMVDISTGGAQLRVATPSALPERFVLVLANGGAIRRECKIMWRRTDSVGVRFTTAKP